MRIVLKLVEREEPEMSEQKKIKITFGDRISLDDSGPSDIIFESNPKRKPTEQIVLGTRRSTSPVEEDLSGWREKVDSVQERNLFALQNSILTDITLEVGAEHIPFKVHKLILALGSPVFEAMFFGPLAEQGEKIIIPDIMSDGFRVLLRHLYGDVIDLDSEVEALNAWIAADKYCVPKLKKECENYFCNCPMSSSNIWKLLENAVFLNLMPLVSRCKHYLESHAESCLRVEGFLETKTDTVKEILKMSSLNVRELVLLKSVIHWGRRKVNSGEASCLTEVLQPLLPQIRFGALTPGEFCQFLDETNDLLEESDALAIFKHLIQPLNYALPSWCCMTTWHRVRDTSASYSRGSAVYSESNQELQDSLRKRAKEIKRFKKQKLLYHSKP